MRRAATYRVQLADSLAAQLGRQLRILLGETGRLALRDAAAGSEVNFGLVGTLERALFTGLTRLKSGQGAYGGVLRARTKSKAWSTRTFKSDATDASNSRSEGRPGLADGGGGGYHVQARGRADQLRASPRPGRAHGVKELTGLGASHGMRSKVRVGEERRRSARYATRRGCGGTAAVKRSGLGSYRAVYPRARLT